MPRPIRSNAHLQPAAEHVRYEASMLTVALQRLEASDPNDKPLRNVLIESAMTRADCTTFSSTRIHSPMTSSPPTLRQDGRLIRRPTALI
jgi:hypothetical protein